MKEAARHRQNPVLTYDFSSALEDTDGDTLANFAPVSRGAVMVGRRQVGTYSIANGKLTLTIMARDWLIGRSSLPGTFGLDITMDEEDTKDDEGESFVFPGAGTIDVTFKKKTENAVKTHYGAQNSDGSWTLYYTASLTVNQKLDDLQFNDTISGEQQLDLSSVKINGNSATASSNGSGFTISSANFKSAIGSSDGIPAGTYRVTYSTTVAADKLLKQSIGSETGTVENNVASWNVDGGANQPGGDTSTKIPYFTPSPIPTAVPDPTPTPNPFGKSSDPSTGTTLTNAGQTITYTIEVGDTGTTLNGLHVQDSMTDLQTLNDGKVYIAYGSPSAARVEMPASAVKWVNDDNYSTGSSQVFDYTFTTDQKGPAYIIYTTTTITQDKATEKGIYGTQTVGNNAVLVNDVSFIESKKEQYRNR